MARLNPTTALQRKVLKTLDCAVNRQGFIQFIGQRPCFDIQPMEFQQITPAGRRQTLAGSLNFIDKGHTHSSSGIHS